MQPQIIFGILLAITLFYFRFGPGVRHFKKKSHHYIVPPSPGKDPNWTPIEPREYDKFIYIKQSSLEDDVENIFNTVKYGCEIEEVNVELINGYFKTSLLQSNFKDFHCAVALLYHTNNEDVYGVWKHITDSDKDYIIKVDEDLGGDYLIGVFRTDQNFGIYLPKSSEHPKGNISLSQVKEIDFDEEFNKLPSA